MKTNRAFILFELVIALSLLSALLLFSQQWLSQQAKRQSSQAGLTGAQQLLTAVEVYWLNEGQTPTTLAELVSKGYITKIWQPWEGTWQLQLEQNMLRLSLMGNDLRQTQRLSEQIPGALINSQGALVLHVFEPVQVVLRSRYLQRYSDANVPENNRMETHLDMNGYSIRNIATLHSDSLVANTATIGIAHFSNAQVARLEVNELIAEQAVIDGHDLAQLADRVTLLQSQWEACRAQGGCQ